MWALVKFFTKASARAGQILAVQTALGSIHVAMVVSTFGRSVLLTVTCVLSFIFTCLLESAALSTAMTLLCWSVTLTVDAVIGREMTLEYGLQRTISTFFGTEKPVPVWVCSLCVFAALLTFDLLASACRKQAERADLKRESVVLYRGKAVWVEFEAPERGAVRVDLWAKDWAEYRAGLYDTKRVLIETIMVEAGDGTTERVLQPGRYFVKLMTRKGFSANRLRVKVRVSEFVLDEAEDQMKAGKQPC